MAYSEEIANKIRNVIADDPEFTEKKMFGGLAFLYHGKMTVGVVGDEMMIRALDTKCQEILKQDFARHMDFTGKIMKEFAFINQDGIQSESDIKYYLKLGVEHAKSKLK